MVLGKLHLKGRLSLPTGHKRALVITPLLRPQVALDEDSVDLRLGSDFLVTRADRLAAIVPGDAQGAEFQRRIHTPLGRYLVLPGHQTVLASTLEYIKLPPDLCAMVLTKSSWARTFITIETAPWVHPCYRGCLTLEIANVSETPLVLYPGVKIAQLVFLEVRQRLPVKDSLKGTFLGTIRPEPPTFKPPIEVLSSELGTNTKYVKTPWGRGEQPARQH